MPLQQGGCMTLAQLGLVLWDDGDCWHSGQHHRELDG
ncbi:hypothetical protein J2W63_003669 [Klebsiella sp. 1400]|nr:hypothetical protein [Klebsiella sp. 1400]